VDLSENPRKSRVYLTKGTSFDNLFNLDSKFFHKLLNELGSKLSLQEAFGVLLDAIEGALWNPELLRNTMRESAPALQKVALGVDPAETSGAAADEHGIVAVGRGFDGHGYVLGDWSLKGTPRQWARRVIDICKRHKIDEIVLETDAGGEMCKEILLGQLGENERLPHIHEVRVGRSGGDKYRRASTVSALYELGRFLNIGHPARLETEMCTYEATSKWSPNHLDAMVHAAMRLFMGAARLGGATGTTERPEGW
jgi:phage terminase large subunit-like protein